MTGGGGGDRKEREGGPLRQKWIKSLVPSGKLSERFGKEGAGARGEGPWRGRKKGGKNHHYHARRNWRGLFSREEKLSGTASCCATSGGN